MLKREKTDASLCDKLKRPLGPIHHLGSNTRNIQVVRKVNGTMRGPFQVSSLFKQKYENNKPCLHCVHLAFQMKNINQIRFEKWCIILLSLRKEATHSFLGVSILLSIPIDTTIDAG